MQRPFYEEERNGLLLVEYEEYEPTKPSFMVLGLPDTGLVGVIAANHLVSSLGLREVGGVDFQTAMPPVAVIHEGQLRTALRLFHKDNIVVLAAETPIPPPMIYPLSSLLIDYAQRKGIDYIISVVGIATPNRGELEKPRVYWLASNEKARKKVEELGLDIFSNGYLVGPYALILKTSVRRRTSNIVLLADAFIDFPDPEAAAEVVKVIGKLAGMEIDVQKLLEQAELIRIKMRELMRQTRQAMAEMQRAPSPMLYA